jgi:hypothetical protein
MDVGMSLLVVNLMLTALTRPAEEEREARVIPGAAAAGGAAR